MKKKCLILVTALIAVLSTPVSANFNTALRTAGMKGWAATGMAIATGSLLMYHYFYNRFSVQLEPVGETGMTVLLKIPRGFFRVTKAKIAIGFPNRQERDRVLKAGLAKDRLEELQGYIDKLEKDQQEGLQRHINQLDNELQRHIDQVQKGQQELQRHVESL